MNHLSFILPLIAAFAIPLLKKHNSKLWRSMSVPLGIVFAVFSTAAFAFMIWAAAAMFYKDLFSLLGKIFCCTEIALLTAFLALLNIGYWKDAKNERRSND